MFKRMLFLTAIMSLGASGCICLPPPGCCASGPRLLPPMLLPPIGCPPVGCPPVGYSQAGYSQVRHQRPRTSAPIQPAGFAPAGNSYVNQPQFLPQTQPVATPPRFRQRDVSSQRNAFSPGLVASKPPVIRAKKYPAVVVDRPKLGKPQQCQCANCTRQANSHCADCEQHRGADTNTCASPVGVCDTCNAVSAFGRPIHSGGAGCDCYSGNGSASTSPTAPAAKDNSGSLSAPKRQTPERQTSERQVPPPAPIPPPPEESEPAQDMTEEAPEPSGTNDGWNPGSRGPTQEPLPEMQPQPEMQRQRPEFEQAPVDPVVPAEADLQPVKFETQYRKNSRPGVASRQIALSQEKKSADKSLEEGQSPIEMTIIPASSVIRKRLQ